MTGPRRDDLQGQTFGRLTVVSFVCVVGKNARWACRCACGVTKVMSASNLKAPGMHSCGCFVREQARSLRRSYVDLRGRRFGRLVVVDKIPESTKRGVREWVCRCDCGRQATVATANLQSGNTGSCGCLAAERRRAWNVVQHEALTTEQRVVNSRNRVNACVKRTVAEMRDHYMKYLLTSSTSLKEPDITREHVRLKREQLGLHRLANEMTQAATKAKEQK